MKLFFRYLSSKRDAILLFVVFAMLFFASFWLFRLPPAAVAYPFLLCVLVGVIWLTYDFLRTRQKYLKLERFKNHITVAEISASGSIPEQELAEMIGLLQAQLQKRAAADEVRYREMVDYYTVWAHQIKTPIASMQLSLQNEDSALSRRLCADLFRIRQYADMVLAFLRLDADSNDLLLKTYALDDIINGAVRKFAPEFIGRKLSLELVPTETQIVTDEKWLSFVLEQLLSNALKYTKTGGIKIKMHDGALTVGDTGIGIAPEDLPRIFEKGYTGYNGRIDQNASGLGLYLCRRVCENLKIALSITSEVGVGTTVFLRFDQANSQME